MTKGREKELVRHEEELELGTAVRDAGSVRVRKTVETEQAVDSVPRTIEQAEIERLPAEEGDSGQVETLPDGSISIPVLEEELVVTKRVVVRERIVIRKEVRTEQERVEGELRKERVQIEGGNE